MPMAAPTAASTPAAETLKEPKAPFDLGVLVEELLLPLPVLVPLLPAALVLRVSVGVADAGGYDAPKALTSKGCETA
jgi:hypothetical protein